MPHYIKHVEQYNDIVTDDTEAAVNRYAIRLSHQQRLLGRSRPRRAARERRREGALSMAEYKTNNRVRLGLEAHAPPAAGRSRTEAGPQSQPGRNRPYDRARRQAGQFV